MRLRPLRSLLRLRRRSGSCRQCFHFLGTRRLFGLRRRRRHRLRCCRLTRHFWLRGFMARRGILVLPRTTRRALLRRIKQQRLVVFCGRFCDCADEAAVVVNVFISWGRNVCLAYDVVVVLACAAVVSRSACDYRDLWPDVEFSCCAEQPAPPYVDG